MSEATPLHVVTTLHPDGTVGDTATFHAAIDASTPQEWRHAAPRTLTDAEAAQIGAVVTPLVTAALADLDTDATPDHFTITLLPDGHLNPSMGLVVMIERAAPAPSYRRDIEVALGESDAESLDALYSSAFASLLSEAGFALAAEPESDAVSADPGE